MENILCLSAWWNMENKMARSIYGKKIMDTMK